MKALKIVGKILLWTLVIVLALLLVSPLWLGPAARGIANSVVPGIIGTDFKLGKLWINKYTGSVSVGDLTIANPEGFSKENCVELGNLDVNLAMTTLCSKKIRIEEIVLDGLSVATTMTGSNFTKIAENASGGGETAKKAETPDVTKAPEPPKPEEKKDEPKADECTKVQIDKLVLKNIKLKYGAVPIVIPMDITLEGIGADKPEGVTLGEAWNAILGAVKNAAGKVGGLGKAVAGAVGDAAGKAVGAVGDAAGTAAGAVGDVAGKAAGAVGDAAGTAAGAVGDAAGKAVGAVGDAAGAAAGAVGGVAGKAAGAVGDAAGKAAGAVGDAVKGIFK